MVTVDADAPVLGAAMSTKPVKIIVTVIVRPDGSLIGVQSQCSVPAVVETILLTQDITVHSVAKPIAKLRQ